ncbi:EAL domain-containing protein, partial [Pseudomonas viridiflava]|uniref:EAL domain-containing protein n=1 Tax=Pseudomonas viridiflava TaxID=33069 RepID=UPI000F067C75
LNLTVIAEGVEQPLQLEFLEQLGCSLYQGYLFCEPLTLSAFEKRLRQPESLFEDSQLNLLG